MWMLLPPFERKTKNGMKINGTMEGEQIFGNQQYASENNVEVGKLWFTVRAFVTDACIHMSICQCQQNGTTSINPQLLLLFPVFSTSIFTYAYLILFECRWVDGNLGERNIDRHSKILHTSIQLNSASSAHTQLGISMYDEMCALFLHIRDIFLKM